MTDLAMRDMEVAMDCVSQCRQSASKFRQSGFPVVADWLDRDAKAIEKWLVKAAKAYPARCGA